jgi:hypothetical protein
MSSRSDIEFRQFEKSLADDFCMTYKTSRARGQLQIVYKDIKKRVRKAESKRVDIDLREYVISAAIFLAFAEIENYIEDVFSAFANCTRANVTAASKLPGYMQPHLFLQKSGATAVFGNYIVSNSERELYRSLAFALSGHAGGYVNDSLPMQTFTGKDLYTTIKYPSEKNLEKLFLRVGVDKVFVALNKILREDAKALLLSISSLRTQLAHTGALPGVSSRDVRGRLDSAERFVGAMDKVIYGLTASKFGAAQWKIHLC